MLGNRVAKRPKVPPCLRRSGYAQAGVKVSQHTHLPLGTFFINWSVNFRDIFLSDKTGPTWPLPRARTGPDTCTQNHRSNAFSFARNL